eukprot:COSAG01_NODE_72277_length_253_cov_1.000000_1_plen_44_part_01
MTSPFSRVCRAIAAYSGQRAQQSRVEGMQIGTRVDIYEDGSRAS